MIKSLGTTSSSYGIENEGTIGEIDNTGTIGSSSKEDIGIKNTGTIGLSGTEVNSYGIYNEKESLIGNGYIPLGKADGQGYIGKEEQVMQEHSEYDTGYQQKT